MSRTEVSSTALKISRKISVFLWASASLVILQQTSACPTRCECQYPEVFCSRTRLTTFPAGLDNVTTFLDVGHNNITTIEEDTFLNLGLVNLIVIVADNNTISSVSPNAFRGLEALKFLHLAGNRLTSLPKDLFSNNPVIHHLDLTGNSLILPSDGPFLSVPSLEYLDLDHCYLRILSEFAFTDLPKLRYVNLNNNSLRHLNGNSLKKLTYLRYFKISGNPFDCECSLKPLWTWLSQHHIKTEASCESPPKFAGKALSVLKNMTCPQ
ncbi:hypothetical protein R5R35_008228 [Gryllus longicercus]|uniref:LRRCT domain-containing protein n=1 Tax=Gryllus longicercus TaxID=2509291 RepID=A0AAN9VVN5_9ORTH